MAEGLNNTSTYKKRTDRKYLECRTYKDYQSYLSDHPEVFVAQMDTVYNDETNDPFLQTFKFVRAGILLALYRNEKTPASMKEGLEIPESILGIE